MRASEIKHHLVQIYASPSEEPPGELPRYLRALEWTGRASNYIDASETLSEQGDVEHYFYPRMLLAGHGLECAMKAALIASGRDPSATHNLVALADQVASCGFHLSDAQLALIVHVDHYFHRDLRSATKYKARYPAGNFESDGGISPPAAPLSQIVRELRVQTSVVNEKLTCGTTTCR